jgi:hypothetical protein
VTRVVAGCMSTVASSPDRKSPVAVMPPDPRGRPRPATEADLLSAWMERTGPRSAVRDQAGLRFAFTAGLDRGLAGPGDIAGEAAGAGRHAGGRPRPDRGGILRLGGEPTLAWARRPQAAALVAALADPDRGWDAIVIGEYERALYGGQYASMAPLFAQYGVQLWTPEAGGPVGTNEDHEQLMRSGSLLRSARAGSGWTTAPAGTRWPAAPRPAPAHTGRGRCTAPRLRSR